METIGWTVLLGALLLGYILGSIPFGLLLTRFAGLGDIRNIGSGNIGTTNVLRTGRRDLAAATLICDALKGTIAVILAGIVFSDQTAALVAGLGAFIGHLFPVWLGFKGGKGVATFLGILIGIAFPAALAFAAIWIGVALITRYSSLSALVASLATPAVLWAMNAHAASWLFLILTALIFFKHTDNIRRLLTGTETKIGSKISSGATKA